MINVWLNDFITLSNWDSHLSFPYQNKAKLRALNLGASSWSWKENLHWNDQNVLRPLHKGCWLKVFHLQYFSGKHFGNYKGFHITFDEHVPKFVQNFRNSLRTWQFQYLLVNQIVNLEITPNFVGKLTSSLREKFAPFGEIISEFP